MNSRTTPSTSGGQRALPAQQPEHFLAMLEALCIANWVALAVIAGVAMVLRSVESFYWPGQDGFDIAFGLIGLEYGLGNLALTLALRFRGWYQSTPREALNRLKQLTLIVLAWDGLHVLGAFTVFGGLGGPLAPLLPLLVAVGFLILPGGQAAAYAIGTLLVTTVLVVLQMQGHLHAAGSLGRNFHNSAGGLALSLFMLAMISLGAFAAGLQMRKRLLAAMGGHPQNLIDTRFGCFSQAALQQRLEDELVRRRTVGGESSLLLLRLQNPEQLQAQSGLDAVENSLAALLLCIQAQTRSHLDTCAYLGDARFGVLLPTASNATARDVAERVQRQFAEGSASNPLACGIASASAQSDYSDAAEWRASAEGALAPGATL